MALDAKNHLMFQKLSPRENQCLYWTLQGKTAKEAGMILNLSQRTVECYLNTARKKLGIRKMIEVACLRWL